ncbi:hypothetical protein JCM10207_009277 [Rhodosporidiobolus poonsookiae]
MSSPSFEAKHVHQVYDEIALDFSRTRHSRWPFVERFFAQLHPGSIVLDAGTGNGKYLGCRSVLNWDGKADEHLPRGKAKGKGKAAPPEHEQLEEPPRPPSDLLAVGYDMSEGLLRIASGKGHEAVRGDCFDMSCWRRGAFDHAISIATIHHFATPARRIESIKQMILCVLPASPPSSSSPSSSPSAAGSTTPARPRPKHEAQILIVVWSLEQDPSLLGARSARRTTGGKKGAVPVASSLPSAEAEGELEGEEAAQGKGREDEQDVFVPWERQEPQVKKPKPPRGRAARPAAAGAGQPTSPSYASASANASANASADASADANFSDRPPPGPTIEPAPAPAPAEKPTFNRYYHLFRHLELSALCRSAADELGLAFDAPAGLAVPVVEAGAGASAGEEGEERDKREGVERREGWEAYVQLKEERWERENWVVEMGVGWRRV